MFVWSVSEKKKKAGGVGRWGAWVELALLASGMLGYETLGGVVAVFALRKCVQCGTTSGINAH